MKNLVLIIVMVVIGMTAQAQTLKTNEVDDFTGDIKKVTTEEKVATSKIRNRLYLKMARIGEVNALYVRTSLDQGCVGGHSNYIILKLQNGETIKLEDDLAKIDCGDYGSSIFRLTEEHMNLLTENYVSKIRYSGSETYDDFFVDSDREQVIKRMAIIVL